nr:hypothetical protein [Tanacetum cinerariifolium]
KDLAVSASSKLFALAYGPTPTPISVNSCVVNDVRFVVHSRDECHTTQNIGICSPGEDEEMYYGQLKQILEFSYMSFKIVLFRVKWFDTSNKGRVKHLIIRNNITQILENGESFKNDQYIFATQVKQCFYLEDIARRPLGWKVIEHVNHKKFSNGGVIVVEDDPDIIHVGNSSDLALTTTLNDFEITALHINGQSIDVDAPPDIIDVDEDTDDEDVLPHDLADFDDEDLANMSADVAKGHGGDDGGDDRLPPHELAEGCRASCWSGRRGSSERLGPSLTYSPTCNPSFWPDIRKGIDQHLGKIYTDNKSSLKRDYWVKNPNDETYNVEAIKSRRFANISAKDLDAQNRFWSDPRTWPGMLKMLETGQRAQSYANRDLGHLLPSEICRPSSIPILWAAYSYETRIDEKMVRLHGLGTYTNDQIMAMVRRGKQQGHILDVGRVLTRRGKAVLDVSVPRCNHTSDLQSQHESGSGSGCGTGEDDESGDDEDAGEDADS